MKAKKKLRAMFVFLLMGSAFAIPSYIDVNATSIPVVAATSTSSEQNDSTISAVELTPWHNFKDSVSNYFNDLYQNIEDFTTYIKDVINDTYGSVENFVQDLVDSFNTN